MRDELISRFKSLSRIIDQLMFPSLDDIELLFKKYSRNVNLIILDESDILFY